MTQAGETTVHRSAAPLEVPKGLEGVVVADTALSNVRGLEGFYHYREYDATELARKATLEDVWCLFFNGALPADASEREAFRRKTASYRAIPPEYFPILRDIGAGTDLLAALRTAVSLIAAKQGFRPSIDATPDEIKENALLISAMTPTLIAALHRMQIGEQPIPPDPELPAAANYLLMLTGRVPEDKYVRALQQYLILTVDHGFNSSTFAARVIASTAADLGGAIVGAIAALSGPLHGGAPSRALAMLDAIGTPERAEGWIRDAVRHGDRIMGFGHRVYKGEDPRSRVLRDLATELGDPFVDYAKHVEATVVRVLGELKPGRDLYTNVEFYAGVVMFLCGIPRDMFTPTFVSSRMIGWCANVLEQVAHNRLFRPSSRYVGPPPSRPVPII